MAVLKKHILDMDFSEEEVLLFAIHSAFDNYRLAYFLNKNLPIFLKQRAQPHTFKQADFESTFFLYHYKDEKSADEFYFVNNAADVNTYIEGEIFEIETTGKIYLVNELKKADYLFKIETEDLEYYRQEFLPLIQSIPGVITAYEVAYEALKSKNHLIFK